MRAAPVNGTYKNIATKAFNVPEWQLNRTSFNFIHMVELAIIMFFTLKRKSFQASVTSR